MSVFSRLRKSNRDEEVFIAELTSDEVIDALAQVYPDRIFHRHKTKRWDYVWLTMKSLGRDRGYFVLTGIADNDSQ